MKTIDEFPWCANSRHWITVFFNLKMPKTCPNVGEQFCEWEDCAYFSWKKSTPFFEKKREIMKRYGMEIISSRRDYEKLEGE